MSTRAYDNSKRTEAARLTRARILAAAREQFLVAGYHDTSMTTLARAAGVSPQTIYNTIGGKAEVLKAVYDVLLAGDDRPVAMNDRPEIARVNAQPDAAATLRAYAAFARMLLTGKAPDGRSILSGKTLALLRADHLTPAQKADYRGNSRSGSAWART